MKEYLTNAIAEMVERCEDTELLYIVYGLLARAGETNG